MVPLSIVPYCTGNFAHLYIVVGCCTYFRLLLSCVFFFPVSLFLAIPCSSGFAFPSRTVLGLVLLPFV